MPTSDNVLDPKDRQRAAELLDEAFWADSPGDLLRKARKILGDSRYDFGRRLGVPANKAHHNCTSLREWETGKHSPTFESRKKFRALADELRDSS
jgi:transcriptional regulator with XRE-family HTH domain